MGLWKNRLVAAVLLLVTAPNPLVDSHLRRHLQVSRSMEGGEEAVHKEQGQGRNGQAHSKAARRDETNRHKFRSLQASFGTVSGCVTDTNGLPIEKIDVHMYSDNFSTMLTPSTENLSIGCFQFIEVPPNEYVFKVDAWRPWSGPFDYLSNYDISLVVQSGEDIVLDVEVPAFGSVTGCVTDSNGYPLGDVEVFLHDWIYRLSWESITDSSTGCYNFSFVPPDSYDFDVEKSDMWGNGYYTIPIVVGDGEHVVQDFQMPAKQTVRGCVEYEDGSAAADIHVYLYQYGAEYGADWTYPVYSATMDSDGCYVIEDVLEGEYSLYLLECYSSYDIVVTPGQDLYLDTATCGSLY